MNQEEIHEKGFDIYNKIKVGRKTLNDALLDMDAIPKSSLNYVNNSAMRDKANIITSMEMKDLSSLRAISRYWYRTNGIYQRACNYFATMYRYDWYIDAEIYDRNYSADKIRDEFYKLSTYLDNSHIAKLCRDIALNVVLDGAYYGYIVDTGNELTLQELPIKYCRSIYSIAGRPVVEFNMRFFDEQFSSPVYRTKVLKLFPKEFQEGYALYKEGKLVSDYPFDKFGWYCLDPSMTVKFSFDNMDFPLLVNAVPALIDLDMASALDRKRQMQQLVKILIQKLPTNKNGDLVFDVDEARDIHDNAIAMLRNTVGVDVLTTFADVEDIDLSDASDTSDNSLENAKDAVYRAMGISENLFDTDGNLALEKSVANDEATVRTLVLQFADLFDKIIVDKSPKIKKYRFRFVMLETTQNNYKDLSDMYKAQTQLGNSKILPQLALGHSQSSIIHTAYFENQVLGLSQIMIPPLQSSVMNAETLEVLGKTGNNLGGAAQENTEAGRPEKPDSEKSEKTIQNLESSS